VLIHGDAYRMMLADPELAESARTAETPAALADLARRSPGRFTVADGRVIVRPAHGDRKPCPNCGRKHIAEAVVSLQETSLGYPDHAWLAIGQLSHAEAELIGRYPDIAAKVREMRKDIENWANAPDGAPPKPDLAGVIRQVSERVRASRPKTMTASIIYYTGGVLPDRIRELCLAQLRKVNEQLGAELITVGREPGDGIQLVEASAPPGILSMLRQILAALDAATGEYAYLAEHDVLYPAEHFAGPRRPGLCYDLACLRLAPDRLYDASRPFLSGLSAPRLFLRDIVATMAADVQAGRRSGANDCEPGYYRGDPWTTTRWSAARARIDIRHGNNLTTDRRNGSCLDHAPGWGPARDLIRTAFGDDAAAAYRSPTKAAAARVHVRATWIPRLADSSLGEAIRDAVADRGYALDVCGITDDWPRLVDTCTHLTTWGCKESHRRYALNHPAVLFVENGLLCQSWGAYVDSTPGGYFAHSSIVGAREFEAAPDEWPQVLAHCRQYLGLGPGDYDPAGPVLIALQTERDAPLLHYAPRWDQQIPAAAWLLRAADKYLKAGVAAVIRPHPRAPDLDAVLKAAGEAVRPDWRVDATGTASDAIRRASAVVTINSTVATEALVTGIPVACLGHGAFTRSTAVLECGDAPERLAHLADWRPDTAAVQGYLCAVWRHLVPYSADLYRVRRNPYISRWLDAITRA
jgi:hypothetical protein